MIEFDSKLARTFLYVCQERTLRAAAYSLDLEPSSVSRQINTLETQLGLPLLERSRKGVVPTEAGRLLLDHLRRQRADNEALLSDFDALRGMQRGEIVIAIGDGFISDFMANALPSFRAALPGISFQLLSGSTEKVAKLVREDVAHFGFAFNPDREQALRVIERVRQPLEVLLSPQSKHAGSGVAMSMSQLTEIPLALPRPEVGIGTLLRETEATYGVRLSGLVETDSLAVLRNFVREDIGATILPAFVVARELADGHVVTVPLDIPELQKGEATILVRTGRRLPEAASRLATHAARAMLAFRRKIQVPNVAPNAT